VSSTSRADQLSLAVQVNRARGPKGARIGDIIVAERTRWRVLQLDVDRREAICRLLGGSHVIRRFRARGIEAVERCRRQAAGDAPTRQQSLL